MKLVQRLTLVCILGLSLVGSASGEQLLEPGLAGTTFDGIDFTRPIEDIDILDKCSNDWSGQRHDGSAQWEGFIQSPFSGEVTFTTRAIDGVRLLIDGKVIIDGLKDSSVRSGKAVLEKGKMTPIMLEHITLNGKGQLHLYWQWHRQEPTIIPTSAIWHDRMKLDQEVLLRKKMIADARSLRNQMLLDPYRPGYHFVIPEGLANPFDVNGGIFWKGRYHLFYIFQQRGRGHSWGHISSIDMLHWRQHRVPLIGKEEGKPDRGMFSGCAFVNKDGIPTIVYHGVRAGTCIATSTDDNLEVWTKSEHNPVIKETKKGDPNYRVYNVFDPVVWIHDGHYYAALGNAHILWKLKDELKPEEKRDRLFLFRSDDLINWKYLHPLYEPNPEWTGPFEDNACPEFFQLGDKWMLLFISHSRGCQYYIGRFENEHFYPESHGRMSWVDSGFFAPESLRDDKGREIMWSWIFDRRNGDTKAKSGWSGTFS
ncbi:MAG: hypothetical protein JRJ85_26880, partial [Deltaproteobacteria bacterium]|nr:hypothetical protein [Deltaproteobacteria bacterium]